MIAGRCVHPLFLTTMLSVYHTPTHYSHDQSLKCAKQYLTMSFLYVSSESLYSKASPFKHKSKANQVLGCFFFSFVCFPSELCWQYKTLIRNQVPAFFYYLLSCTVSKSTLADLFPSAIILS